MWKVIATESMGTEVVLWRGDDKDKARAEKSSFSKDGAYTRLRIVEGGENE